MNKFLISGILITSIGLIAGCSKEENEDQGPFIATDGVTIYLNTDKYDKSFVNKILELDGGIKLFLSDNRKHIYRVGYSETNGYYTYTDTDYTYWDAHANGLLLYSFSYKYLLKVTKSDGKITVSGTRERQDSKYPISGEIKQADPQILSYLNKEEEANKIREENERKEKEVNKKVGSLSVKVATDDQYLKSYTLNIQNSNKNYSLRLRPTIPSWKNVWLSFYDCTEDNGYCSEITSITCQEKEGTYKTSWICESQVGNAQDLPLTNFDMVFELCDADKNCNVSQTLDGFY
jgi:hypothetical protein